MGSIIFGIIIGLFASVGYYIAYGQWQLDKERSSKRWGDGSVKAKKPSKGLALLILMVPVLLFTAVASTTRVGTGEIAVMTRFGRVTGQELGEGFHFKSPLDKANKYDIKVQKEESSAAAASKDLQDVNATLVINYSLEAGKVSEIHRNVGSLYKEKLIDPAVPEVVKAATARFNATEIITKRPEVKAVAFEELKARLEPYGIIISDLSLTNIEFSPEFTAAIESKQVAEQDAQRAVFVAQKAEQEAQAAIERARGESEAQRLLTQTASDQSIQLKRLEVQAAAINKWNGVLPTHSLSENSDFLLQVGN